MNKVIEYVDQNRSRLIELTRELVRRPSENKPPVGSEGACQEYIADRAAAREGEAADYAQFLLGLTRAPAVPTGATGVTGNSSDLFRRITMLLKPHDPLEKRSSWPWTLAAWCEVRSDFRNFRLDRIRGPAILERFEDEPGRTLRDMLTRYGPDAVKLVES